MKIRLLIIFLIAFTAPFFRVQAHPYHTSIAEVRYNAKTQALEIALKVFTDDLEKALAIPGQKPLIIKQTPEIQQQLDAYLKKKFRLELTKNQVLSQRFIGFETQGDAQWLYLEIPAKSNQLISLKIRNEVLVETFPDQVNLVNLDINGQKRTLLFKEGEVVKPLL